MAVFDLVFYLLAALTLVSGLAVATSRNIVHSAFALIFALVGVAGLYLQVAADFLAVLQILVYVGGITVVILFAVMLTRKISDATGSNPAMNRPAAALASAGVLVVLLFLILNTDWPTRGIVDFQPVTSDLGHALLSKYLLPFELVSLLLLGALIGAVVIARKEVRGGNDEEVAE